MKINSPGRPYPIHPTPPGERSASTYSRILAPIVGENPSKGLPRLAVSLATDETEVVLLRPVSIPEQTPQRLASSQTEAHRAVLQDVMTELPETDVSIETAIQVGHGFEDIFTHAIRNHGITTLLLPTTACEPTSITSLVRPDLGTRIRQSTACNVVIVRGPDRVSDITSIVAAVAGGPHAELAVDVAAGLTGGFDASLDLVHVIEPDASTSRRERGTAYLDSAAERLGSLEQYETRLVEADDVADGILAESATSDLAIVGAPRRGRLRRFIHGSTTPRVQTAAETTVLTTHRREGERERLRPWNLISGET